MTVVRVALPTHLRAMAGVGREVAVEVGEPATIDGVLDALEAHHPVLKGTIRDHTGGRRRAFIRFFACGVDLSHDPTDAPLPDPVVSGTEVLRVIGAIAGG